MENIKFAINYLIKNKYKLLEDDNNYGNQSIKMAIEALEKQIPKRVNKASENKLNTNLCPVCSREVRIGQFYCETCGQKLNWD